MAEITALLKRWGAGDGTARDELIGLVYQEIRAIARALMRNERRGHILDTTSLVHEAYLRLAGQEQMDWQNRAHFYGAAATAMRRILVDEARKRLSVKRGSGSEPESLDAFAAIQLEPDLDIVALHGALEELAELDPERARVVDLRYILGLSIEETAGVLGRSPQSVSRDWTAAKAWLARRLRPRRDEAG